MTTAVCSVHLNIKQINAYYMNKYGVNPSPDETLNAYFRNKYGDEEEMSAEQQAVALRTFMASMAFEKDTEAIIKAELEEYRIQLNAYLRNRYGDEYADVDELGFETSGMGLRADHNHIF